MKNVLKKTLALLAVAALLATPLQALAAACPTCGGYGNAVSCRGQVDASGFTCGYFPLVCKPRNIYYDKNLKCSNSACGRGFIGDSHLHAYIHDVCDLYIFVG